VKEGVEAKGAPAGGEGSDEFGQGAFPKTALEELVKAGQAGGENVATARTCLRKFLAQELAKLDDFGRVSHGCWETLAAGG